MDEDVIRALARWPDVPAVYGWLSLDARGRWRLHPGGDAAAGSAGEPISHPGTLAFIGRNYARDERDCWYFQNGPQRVYVRLDAAPWLLRRADAGPGLQTHTGLSVPAVSRWWMDDEGRLYAETGLGPGMIEDRELAPLLARLRTGDDEPALDALAAWLEGGTAGGSAVASLSLDGGPPAPLARIARAQIPARLGFRANPAP